MNDKLIYLHNPRCRKSREGLELLQSRGIELEVRKYLENPLGKSEIKALAGKLDPGSLDGWIRTGEQEFKDHYKGRELTTEQWAEALEKHPKLLERPILIKGDKAVVGRPPIRLLELL